MPDIIMTSRPVLAWRAWRLAVGVGGSFFLVSLNGRDPADNSMRWLPGRREAAECVWFRHSAPEWGCGCGYYAVRREGLSALLDWGAFTDRRGRRIAMYATPVVGRAAMWGRVIEHVRGFRAEFAYPIAISIPCPVCWKSEVFRHAERALVWRRPGRVSDLMVLPTCDRHRAWAARNLDDAEDDLKARDVLDGLCSSYDVNSMDSFDISLPPK